MPKRHILQSPFLHLQQVLGEIGKSVVFFVLFSHQSARYCCAAALAESELESAAEESVCGRRPRGTERVVDLPDEVDWPWMGSYGFRPAAGAEWSHVCGGTLVSKCGCFRNRIMFPQAKIRNVYAHKVQFAINLFSKLWRCNSVTT